MFQGTKDIYDPLRVRLVAIKNFSDREKTNISNFCNCFSIFFLSKGIIKIKVNGKNYKIFAPVLICLSNRDEIASIKLYKNTKINVIYFDTVFLTKGMTMDHVFNTKFIETANQHYFCQLGPFIEKDLNKKCFILNPIFSKRISEIVEKMKFQLNMQPDFYWSCRARSCLLEILVIIENFLYDLPILDENTYDISTYEKVEFKKILEYVVGNIDKNIQLKDLYEKFFFNKQKIQKLFRKYYGSTYKQFVKEQRFIISKNDLRFTDLSLKEIAGKVGYSSTQSFSKFFKEMSGTTPIAFRQTEVSTRKTGYFLNFD